MKLLEAFFIGWCIISTLLYFRMKHLLRKYKEKIKLMDHEREQLYEKQYMLRRDLHTSRNLLDVCRKSKK